MPSVCHRENPDRKVSSQRRNEPRSRTVKAMRAPPLAPAQQVAAAPWMLSQNRPVPYLRRALIGVPPELDDIQNRLDFAERVLAQVKARDALPGPR